MQESDVHSVSDLPTYARSQSRVSSPSKILAIDDEQQTLDFVSAVLSTAGLEVLTADSHQRATEIVRQSRPSIVLLDLKMPGIKGFELLDSIIAFDPGTEVIIMTAHYSTESAVEAIQKGACDYLEKPLSVEKLKNRILSLLSDAERRRKTLRLEHELLDVYRFEGIIGRSPLMLDVFAKVRRVAPHFRNVLLTGATGTGKELVARALQRLSPAARGEFVVCNCSAIVETLVESELFGYVRGAFTGATQDKVGIFEYANRGTVFLDEVGELSASAQGKLLRVLQNAEIQRIGSPIPKAVDVRVIAATNRDLRAMVNQGKFRQDLFYRLSMVEISLPRLLDRKEDIPLLQRHFLEKFSSEYQKPITGMTRRAQKQLSVYSWPGNVRELENVMGHACMMAEGPVIDVEDLPEGVRARAVDLTSEDEMLLPMEEIQKRHAMRVLKQVNGNKSRAAEILGISRATLYQMLADTNLEDAG